MIDFEKVLLCPKVTEMSAFEQKGKDSAGDIQKKGNAKNEHVNDVEQGFKKQDADNKI